MYNVFPILGNESLLDLVYNRLQELGYNKISNVVLNCGLEGSLSISDNNYNFIYHTDKESVEKLLKGETVRYHQLGSLSDLLFTNKYRIDESIKIFINDSYTAEVTSNGIQVGCQHIPMDKVKELIIAVQKKLK